MNAPHAFAENATSTCDSEPDNNGIESPSYFSKKVVKRRARRRFMERFEQAFFVGVLLTLIAFTVHIVFSEYSAPSAMGASAEESALTPETNVGVTWEDEPTFGVPTVPQMEDSESYQTVGEEVDTTWLQGEGGNGGLESSPYVKEDSTLEDSTSEEVLEPVPAPDATETETETEVPVVEQEPGSEVSAVESLTPDAARGSAPIGVLRVGGGHARDLIRLYTYPAVVYGLE